MEKRDGRPTEADIDGAAEWMVAYLRAQAQSRGLPITAYVSGDDQEVRAFHTQRRRLEAGGKAR